MRFGALVTGPVPWPVTNEHPLKDTFPIPTTLYNVALQWLKDDRDFRRGLENQGRKLRGARRNEVCSLLSAVAYILFDYHFSARAI